MPSAIVLKGRWERVSGAHLCFMVVAYNGAKVKGLTFRWPHYFLCWEGACAWRLEDGVVGFGPGKAQELVVIGVERDGWIVEIVWGVRLFHFHLRVDRVDFGLVLDERVLGSPCGRLVLSLVWMGGVRLNDGLEVCVFEAVKCEGRGWRFEPEDFGVGNVECAIWGAALAAGVGCRSPVASRHEPKVLFLSCDDFASFHRDVV